MLHNVSVFVWESNCNMFFVCLNSFFPGMLFFSYLVEDSIPKGGQSYSEFLVDLHRNIQSKLSWSFTWVTNSIKGASSRRKSKWAIAIYWKKTGSGFLRKGAETSATLNLSEPTSCLIALNLSFLLALKNHPTRTKSVSLFLISHSSKIKHVYTG